MLLSFDKSWSVNSCLLTEMEAISLAGSDVKGTEWEESESFERCLSSTGLAVKSVKAAISTECGRK